VADASATAAFSAITVTESASPKLKALGDLDELVPIPSGQSFWEILKPSFFDRGELAA